MRLLALVADDAPAETETESADPAQWLDDDRRFDRPREPVEWAGVFFRLLVDVGFGARHVDERRFHPLGERHVADLDRREVEEAVVVAAEPLLRVALVG